MKKDNSSLFNFLILIAGILAALTAFLPALAYGNSDSVFRGYELVIGTEFVDLGNFASGQIEPNVLIGIAFLQPLLACLLAVFVKKGAVISILLFIIASVMLILVPEMTVASVTVLGNTTEIEIEWTLAYGLYLAIGLSFFGALLSIYQVSSRTFRD